MSARHDARALSAPGKLVLVGEYAVLEGHPAIVAAVDRRARAAVRLPATTDAATPHALDTPLGRAVVNAAIAAGFQDAPTPFQVDTTAFSHGADKLGLGSSAAAAVVMAGAIVAVNPPSIDEAARDAIFRVALEGHRAFQGGAGSGVDVAASTFGGVLVFCRSGDAGPPFPACRLPTDLASVVVFTGAPTATTNFVSAWRDLPDRSARAARIGDAVAQFQSGCAANDATAVCRAIDAARDALQDAGEAAGIDIVSAPHRRIAAVARVCGGAAKPSGAGGGDVAVAFVPPDARRTFAAQVEADGFLVVPTALGADGVQFD